MHQSPDRMRDAVVNGDGAIVEVLPEKSRKQKLQSSGLFDFPVACSSNYEEAAMARLSQIGLHVSFTPQPRIEFQYHSCSSLDDADSSERRDLSKRSYSFPVLRSMNPSFRSPKSPISAAISHAPWDLDAWQPQQQQQEEEEEEDEIVEVPITVPCRRSKSLRELFDDDKLAESGDFPARNDGFFSAEPDLFFKVNKSSPISHHASLRSSSSGRATLHELLHSEPDDSPQTYHRLRSKHKKRRTLSWKLSMQSIKAKSEQKKDQNEANSKERETQKKQACATILPKSGVNLQKKGPQIEILSQADATSIRKEELSQQHKASIPEADYKLEAQQMAKLQRAPSHARESRPISRDSGWGKLEVKPAAAMPTLQSTRSSSSQVALTRQASTHEQYYISRKTARVRQRKRTNLPYRENLINFCCCNPAQSSSVP